MKNLVINAFGDLVERTDYGNHKNQLNLFDNLNEIVEENITTDDILDFLFGNNRKGNNGIIHDQTEIIHEVDGEVVTEPLEDVLEREQLEMEAELSVGI